MGDCLGRGMRERKHSMIHAQFLSKVGSYAMENDHGTATGLSLNFHIAPADTVIPSCPQCLHTSFFGGEASRKSFYTVGLRLAVTNLSLGEDTLQKTITEALDRSRQARHFDNIDTGAHNHAGKITQLLPR